MKQFRIGIVGTENSHAHGFTTAFNKADENGNYKYPDFRVTLVYGHYPEENERLVKEFGADKVAENLEEMVANVDAVIVCARDGKFHYEFAKPFIEAGIPAFIDKPFTTNPDEAVALINLAKEKGVPLCGGSMLKFTDNVMDAKAAREKGEREILGGSICAPVILKSEYSGFFFYASHLAEMTLESFGYNPLSVTAKLSKGGVCATVNYENFSVSNQFTENGWNYALSVYTTKELVASAVSLDNAGDREIEEFVQMVRTGHMGNTYEELAFPVFYLNAVKKAYETGEEVKIEAKF
ncbi:MAG: Gfo/Idh/MocA family oxidoreductase [Clostridia bacterium]|nr:Gfo/Idh/MocA family oxidoreductase [Clostridia bacterium]